MNPPKPPLITPSASPPVSRSFFPPPYRISGFAPPFKRPRLSSGPRQSHNQNQAASSSSDDVDVNSERAASTLRLFDVWSGLAERYARPIDEDDIVDLATGNVVKDRGILSAASRWEFGGPRESEGEEEAEGEGGDTDPDAEETDELALCGGGFIPEGEKRAIGRSVPPVREMDPEDARDLEEFLQAEQERRERFGSEAASEESDEIDSAHAVATAHHERVANRPPPSTIRQPSPITIEDESDDELNVWGVIDETNITYDVIKDEDEPPTLDPLPTRAAPSNTSRSPSKAISTPKTQTVKRSPPLSHKYPTRSFSKPKSTPSQTASTPAPNHHQQLQTPPHTHTPSSDIDFFVPVSFDPEIESPSPPNRRGTSVSRTRPTPSSSDCYSSPIKQKGRKEYVLVPDDDDDEAQILVPSAFSDSVIPRLDLTQVERGRSTRRGVPEDRSFSLKKAAHSSSTPKLLPDKKDKGKEKEKERKPLPPKSDAKKRLQAEVVITRSPSVAVHQPPRAPISSDKDDGEKNLHPSPHSKEKRKDKGKAREFAPDSEHEQNWEYGLENPDLNPSPSYMEDSDDPLGVGESSSSQSRSRRVSRRPSAGPSSPSGNSSSSSPVSSTTPMQSKKQSTKGRHQLPAPSLSKLDISAELSSPLASSSKLGKPSRSETKTRPVLDVRSGTRKRKRMSSPIFANGWSFILFVGRSMNVMLHR